MDVNPDEVIAYFASTGASGQCPFCAQEEWKISGIHTDAEKISLAYADLQITQMPVILLICTTCGFVRMQSLEHLQQWLSSTRSGNDHEIGS